MLVLSSGTQTEEAPAGCGCGRGWRVDGNQGDEVGVSVSDTGGCSRGDRGGELIVPLRPSRASQVTCEARHRYRSPRLDVQRHMSKLLANLRQWASAFLRAPGPGSNIAGTIRYAYEGPMIHAGNGDEREEKKIAGAAVAEATWIQTSRQPDTARDNEGCDPDFLAMQEVSFRGMQRNAQKRTKRR